jgi:hypothetical protein
LNSYAVRITGETLLLNEIKAIKTLVKIITEWSIKFITSRIITPVFISHLVKLIRTGEKVSGEVGTSGKESQLRQMSYWFLICGYRLASQEEMHLQLFRKY